MLLVFREMETRHVSRRSGIDRGNVLEGGPLARMARNKTTDELYKLMSEVISLRERVAQAELAAANSRMLWPALDDGSDPAKRRR